MRQALVPILMYHEVAARPHPAFRRYTVTPRAFARQMRWLAAFKYQPIDMDTLLSARLGLARLPKRPVVITFDDGLQGSLDHAVPVLRSLGFTAVFYLVAGLMGNTSRWLRQELDMELPIMSWAAARSLAAAGLQCGAHTLTHPRLAGLDPGHLRNELVDARARLEDELGRAVVHLAYPFGSYDVPAQRAAEEAGYLTACTTRTGFSGPHDDFFALQRVPIYGGETLIDFACRLRTARTLPERVQRALRYTARRMTRRPGFLR